MRILVAPSAFKGSFTPKQIASAIARGVHMYAETVPESKVPYIDECPLADGGDGTLEALQQASGGQLIACECSGTLGETRRPFWLKQDRQAIVELAQSCGLGAAPYKDPLKASTAGLGQVIRQALADQSIRELTIAVGGSASTDGGSGALAELGARFFNAAGQPVTICGGISLSQVATCDLRAVVRCFEKIKLTVITDVSNPLLGPAGAAEVFAPQKGAGPQEVQQLESALETYADALEQAAGTSCRNLPGAGAAGGTAFAFACLGAEITSGFLFIANFTELTQRIKNSDLVITGEGQVDRTSEHGKAQGELVSLCRLLNRPLWTVAGKIEAGCNSTNEHILIAAAKSGHASLDDIAQSISTALRERTITSC